MAWKIPQEEPFVSELACTSCPIAVDDKLIVHTARSVQAFDISTGEQIWVVKCATTATSTPVLAGEEVIVAAWNKLGEPALRPAFPSFEELVKENDKNDDKYRVEGIGDISGLGFPQSPNIAKGDGPGGDQRLAGPPCTEEPMDETELLMSGYACRETEELMPLPITVAHGLTRRLADARGDDGNTHATVFARLQ